MNAIPVPGDLENRVLRRAVQDNLVSFPSQVPVFGKRSRPDLQQRIVALYFVSGWTMDDIARRYGMGRQRMGQILTDWRIRAVREGYIQAIEPEHPIFKRVRLEQTSQSPDPAAAGAPAVDPVSSIAPVVTASEVEQPPLTMPKVAELRESNLAEQLHTIVAILDNQLRVCSKPLIGSIEPCEQLLARAKMLCARLEAQISVTRNNDEDLATAVILAAQELFLRFKQHAFMYSGAPPELDRSQDSNEQATEKRSVPPRASQRVAVRL